MRSSLAIKERYDRLAAAKGILLIELAELAEEVAANKAKAETYTKAKIVLLEVARQTQEGFKNRVEALVTLAVRAVYENPYVFRLNFETKSNTLHCTPVIVDGEDEFLPEDERGGGLVDVISFALRIVLWSLEEPRSRNLFILDEPFKWTGALIEKAGAVLKRLSEELNFQVLMISHDDELITVCDRVWRVVHDGEQSKIKRIKRTILRRVK